MELADPGGESPRRDRAHPVAMGPAGTRSPRPWIARAVPRLGGREDGRGDGGVGGREGEASDSRAGSGVQQGAVFGEASRGGVESGRRGVGLRVEREGLLGGRWPPSEAPDCQRAEFDVWCGDALGKQSRASGWGLGKWQRTWGVGVCGQRPFFSHLGETLVME